jgi:hypothetical protein
MSPTSRGSRLASRSDFTEAHASDGVHLEAAASGERDQPDLPAKIICTMRLSPQAGFHARCKGLRGHVERYAFLLHAADSLPGGIGEVEVEEALVGGQRGEGTPGRAGDGLPFSSVQAPNFSYAS